MSFIQESTAPSIDTLGTGTLLDDTRLTEQQRDAARATLARHGALDLAAALGLTEVTA